MTSNIYIYILVMAGVSFAIRALPLTLIQKQIKTGLSSPFCTTCPTSPWPL